MKKRILVVALLAVLITGCGEIPKLKDGSDAIVELKDGTKYSVDEIWEEFKESYALDLILNKIDKKILESEFKDKENEIKEYLSSIETYFKSNYETEEEMENALNRNGYSSLDDYLDYQKVVYLRDLAVTEYAESKITDKEIEKYYKDKTVGDIEAVHVLVKPEGTDTASDKAAKEKAEKIIKDIEKDIKSGTKAIDAFKKYESNKEVTYENLGKYSKGKNVEAFDDAAFKLKKGEYTKSPVKTSYGYHVILKTNEYDKPKLEDVKDSIKTTLGTELKSSSKTIQAEAMNELRKKNDIKFYDDKLEQAYNKYMNYLLNQ